MGTTWPACCNALTRRWLEVFDDPKEGFVLSGPAVWPLLAVLAVGADDAARQELEGALGLPAADALASAKDFLQWLRRSEAVHAGLAVWLMPTVDVYDGWAQALPEGALQRLRGSDDAETLDAWVREHTDGIVDRFPGSIDGATRLLLAQAVAVRTDWTVPFEDTDFRPASGPWRDRAFNGLVAELGELDRVAVFETDMGKISTFRSTGSEDVDVYLVLGEEQMTPTKILGLAVEALTGSRKGIPGTELSRGDEAPGLTVDEIESSWAGPTTVLVSTVRFDVTSTHDLMAHARVFGLATAAAMDSFSKISDPPLRVGHARQEARAIFTATGFEAAAVTATPIALSAPPALTTTRLQIRLTFDRPFGFIALPRDTDVVLFAGWVAQPEDYRQRELPAWVLAEREERLRETERRG